MNFPVSHSFLGRQRCRYWTPLFTQQLRLQHVYQIIIYNTNAENGGDFYYTLHLTTMCAPFYTSEKISCSNPKWTELDTDNLPYPSLSVFVLRIWQSQDDDMDLIKTTWGIHLSGLVYLGTKLSEIQPESFHENTVIFNMRGGFFSSLHSIRITIQTSLPFIDNMNTISTEYETFIYRNIVIKVLKSEVKDSYNVASLQKLHSLHLSIKNTNSLVESLRERINNDCGLCKSSSNEIIADNPSPVQRHSSQLLTMSALHKMLQFQQGKPSKLLLQQITAIKKQIEIAKFRTKLLSQERDKKSAYIRQLKQKLTSLIDENEESGLLLMESYRKLSKDGDKLKECHRKQIKLRESIFQTNTQLSHRRCQLLSQLLFIYPIQQLSEHKWVINGIYLPNSEEFKDCSVGGHAVSLGYTAHILVMCSTIIQVPLRYPITYFGSRSYISDNITPGLGDKAQAFPLYEGKNQIQFNYGVYLLNKNIAQMRWVCGLHTADLKATLSNLHTLLIGKSKTKKISNSEILLDTESINTDYTLNSVDTVLIHERACCANRIKKNDAQLSRPGLSEILAIPEAFMSKQISSSAFKSYANTERLKQLSALVDTKETDSKASTSNDTDKQLHLNDMIKSDIGDLNGIERGTDILHSCLNQMEEPSFELVDGPPIVEEVLKSKNRHISRSVDCIIDEDYSQIHNNPELGSDPLLHSSSKALDLLSLEDGQQDFLQKWLDSGPALVCSEESLYPDEILGTTGSASTSSNNNHLTLRTDALLSTTSFNLVKPK